MYSGSLVYIMTMRQKYLQIAYGNLKFLRKTILSPNYFYFPGFIDIKAKILSKKYFPMIEGDLHVPSQLQIDSWNNIKESPVVDTAPRVVPLPVFITPSSEGNYDRVASLKTELAGSKLLKIIRECDINISSIDEFLKSCYCKRSMSHALLTHIENLKKQQGTNEMPKVFMTPEVSEIAKAMSDPILGIFKSIREQSDEVAGWFYRLFANDENWLKGIYNDQLLNGICTLIYKLTALENLIIYKTALVDDISMFLKFQNNPTYMQDVITVRSWLQNFGAITNLCVERMSQLKYQQIQYVFDLLYDFCHEQIIKENYITAESRYSYIATIIFIVKLYEQARIAEENELKQKSKKDKKAKPILKPIPLSVRFFCRDIAMMHKSIVLIYEVAPEISQFFPKDFLEFNKKEMKEAPPPSLKVKSEQDVLDEVRAAFDETSTFVSYLLSLESVSKESLPAEVMPSVLRKISSAICMIAEKIEHRRLQPPPIPKDKPELPRDKLAWSRYQYEYNMNDGIYDILQRILPLIMTCRITKEVLQEHIGVISQQLSAYMQEYIQDFCVNKIASLCNKKKEIEKELMVIRTLLGYFTSDDDLKIPKKVKTQKLNYPATIPSLQFLELARAQISAMINPGSHWTKKKTFGKAILGSDEIEVLQEFLNKTTFFAELIRLPETLDIAFDQSRLFFKEHWLDICRVSYFKVSSSLPYILSNFALQNYNQTELTGAIFYPLSIYDDAAHVALNKLKSKLLYEEIKAEAEICLVSITRIIANQSFSPIREFITISSLSENVMKELRHERLLKTTGNAPAVRLGVLLQQNQLFVLGCQIETKLLIANRLNELFKESMEGILKLASDYGPIVMIGFDRMIELLRSTHNMIASFDIPISPFRDLFRIVMAMDTPNSLQSSLLVQMAQYISGPLLSEYFLMTTPFRLIPRSQPNIDFHKLFHQNESLVLERVLRPTATFVSIESFRCLFKYLDNGAITMLHMQLISELPEIMQEFVKVYNEFKQNITRIRDPPLGSSCPQAYDRFYGAYNGFLGNGKITQIFEIMSQIGIIFALSTMMDDAFNMKYTSEKMLASYVTSRSPINDEVAPVPEIFESFDATFRDTINYFSELKVIPEPTHVLPPFTYLTTLEFVKIVLSDDTFNETAPNLTNFQSLKGFAAVFSILEFLYCILEANTGNAINKYGESVLICAANILAATKQIDLYKVLSITGRILTHYDADFNHNTNPQLQNFINISKLMQSSLWIALTSSYPFFDEITGQSRSAK